MVVDVAGATTADSLRVDVGYVYTNAAGDARIVVSVRSLRQPDPVIIWRTALPALPPGVKAQGSATLRAFRRWAVTCRKANKQDLEAFDEVARRRLWARRDAQFIRAFRRKRDAAKR